MINQFVERINNVEKVLNGIYFKNYNDLTKETITVIDEKHFRKCFDVFRSIKDDLNFPINDAGLIFRSNDSIDLNSFMSDVIEGG